MPSIPSLYIIQWGIIGLFVFLFFILGILRGAQKSLYFMVINIVTTFLALYIVSNLSIASAFRFMDQTTYLNMINQQTGGLLTDYLGYMDDPLIASTVYIFVDLVLRIVGFIILYPLLKRILTLFIFRPIWAFGIKKAIIAKQNKSLEVEAAQKNVKFKPRKRIKKGFGNRILGGLFGGVEGFIVIFIILIPLTVFASYTANIDTEALSSSQYSQTELANGSVAGFNIPPEVIDYLQQVQEMNDQGLASITSQVKIGGVSIDRYIFDQVFTVDASVNGEDVSINFINELDNIIGIATVLVNGGYLDPNFDYTTISTDNLGDLEAIMQYVGNSDVLAYLIPTAVKYGVDNLLVDQMGIDLTDRAASQAALDMFYNIDWSNEFDRLYALVESVLTFGSIDDIMNIMSDPNALASLTPEQGVALANIIRSAGDLEILSLLNVGVDYLTTISQVQDQIGWLETSSEKEDYLQEKLAFILDNPDFFVGDQGEISQIAGLIELIFSDTYGDTNLDQIVSANGDIATILSVQNSDWVSALFTQLTQIQTLMNTLPIGVDFALYQAGGDQIDAQLASDLETALADINWADETMNFDNIYQSIVELGLEQILVDNPDYYAYMDYLLANNMDDVRNIVTYIFEDSDLVGNALDTVAPILISNYITDTDLQAIIESIVLNQDDEFTFNVGQELINVLNIAESSYQFVAPSDLQGFSQMTQEDQLQILAAFGQMSDTDYQQFITAFGDLQILNRINQDNAPDIAAKFNLTDTVYIPTTFTLSDDVVSLLSMVHDVGVYLNDNYTQGQDYQDLDLTSLLTVLKADLTDPTKRSDLLFYNIANYAKIQSDGGSLSQYLSVPDSLLTADVESQAWSDEISALLSSVFDIASTVGQTDGITLSVHDVLLYSKEAYRLPVELITQFSDPVIANQAFGSLDSSLILRTTIANMIDSQGEGLSGSLFGHVISTPAHLKTDGAINTGVFVDLIEGFATFVDGMNQSLGYTQFGNFTFDNLSPYFNAFNQMDNQDIEALVESDLLRGIVSEMLFDQTFQSSLADTLNNAQDIIDFPQDFFAVDPTLIDGPVLVSGEITNLFIMFKALELQGVDGFSSIGLQTFTNLVVADPVTGEDKFDEFFASNYIYTIIDKVLQLDSISSYVSTLLGDSLGADFSTLDLSIPDAMLGQTSELVAGDIGAVEVGRIPKAEFRRIFESLNALGDMSTIGLETFTNMIDPSQTQDDFSTFIASDFIYVVLSRLIGNEGFSSYAEDALSGAFGNDPITLDLSVPTDALGTTDVEDGFITRTELRNLMVSFKMLGFGGESALDVATIINMPTLNTYSQTEDDLNIFLNSIYLRNMMSQMLLSPTIIDMIGAGQFTSVEFDLPLNAYDPIITDRLAKQQIHLLFDSLILLGIGNFESMDLGIDTVTSLTSVEQQQLLDSLYLYEVIDLMIKAQEATNPGDTGLTIPLDAYVTGGYYDQMISQNEILAILGVFNIVGSDPQAIDPNTITTSDLMDVLDLGSVIINQMISDQIETALTIDNTTIPEAYVTTIGVDRIKDMEMKALIEAMNVIGLSDLSGSFAVDSLGLSDLQDLHYLGLGTDPVVDTYNSYIIHNMISEQVETALSFDETTLPEAYTNASGEYRILPDEIQAMIVAMSEMGITDLQASFSADNLTVSQLQNVHYVGLGIDPLGDTYNSYIIHRLISDGVKGILTNLPSTVYMSNNDIKAAEIQGVIDAIGILNNDPNASLSGMSFANTGLTAGKIESLLDLNSLIIDRQISDGIISAHLDVLEAYAISGDYNYDSLYATGDLKITEMYALVAAMSEMGITDLSGSFDPNSITVAKLQNLHYIGLGTDPILDQFDSYIVHHMVSDGISSALTNLPSTVFMANGDIIPAEVQGVISAIGILNNDPNASLGAMSFANAGLTPTKIENLLDLNSLIIDRQISEGIISASLDVSEAYAISGDFNYDSLYATGDLKVSEMYALVEAMNIMGLSDLTGSFDPSSITVSNLQDLHYVGLGTDPLLDTYDSYIVHHMISDGIASSLTNRPSTVYMANGDILAAEVQGVISAIGILNNDPNATLATMSFANSGLTPAKMESLLDLGSLIIDRQISEGIITASLDVPEAYAISGDYNFDTLYATGDLKVAEMYALVEAMNIMGLSDLTGSFAADQITIDKLQLLHYVGLGVDPLVDTYNSYMVHNMLSDAMDNALDVPTNGYMGSGYMLAAEIQGVIDALNIISSDPNDTLSDIMPINDNSIFTAATLESLLDINTLTIYRLVAKGIIDSGIATLESRAELGDVNYDSNAIGEDLKVAEMYGLVTSMNLLGISDVTQVSSINSASVMGLSDSEVDQILDNSNTITYYIIDDVIDPADNLFPGQYFTDLNGDTRIIRTTLITFIKNNN